MPTNREEKVLLLVEPESGAEALRVRFAFDDAAELLGEVVAIIPGELEEDDALPEAARAAIYENEFEVATAGGHPAANVAQFYDGVYRALVALARDEGLRLVAEEPNISQSAAFRAGGVM